MGIYSCTKDLVTFFRKLLDALANKSVTPNQNIVNRFLHPYVEFSDDRGSYSFCGLHTNLCTTQLGSGSLNRLVTMPASRASKYTLGVGQNGRHRKLYMAPGGHRLRMLLLLHAKHEGLRHCPL